VPSPGCSASTVPDRTCGDSRGGLLSRRIKRALLAAAALSFLPVAACTHANPAPAPTVTSTRTITRTPAAVPTSPVVAGPTTTTRKDCPLVRLAAATPIIGQRLDHSTVRQSGGKTVGCDFYPITSGVLAQKERLPKNGFPSARITITTYPSAESARQVLAIVSRAGGSPSRQSVAGLVGETFQTRFYPPDGKADWACAFIKGPKLVTVVVAESTSEGQTIVTDLANTFARRV
jgi:hypothetical protein